jgi:hypothetical protein
MPKGESGLTEVGKLRGALLRGGARTYPQAMQALAEFRQEVFSICRRVAEPRKNGICRLLGIPASKVEIKKEGEEVDAFQDGIDTYLCVYLSHANLCSFGIGLWWEEGDERPLPVKVVAWITFERKTMFENVKNALQDRFGDQAKTVDSYPWQCYVDRLIQPIQISCLGSELGKVTDTWIRMLRAVNIRKLIR